MTIDLFTKAAITLTTAYVLQLILSSYLNHREATMSKQRVIVTGASGLLGRAIYSEFKGHPDWDTLGLAFSRAKGDLVKVDITKEEEVANVVKNFKPTVIVHSAAERKPDAVEQQPEATRLLNIQATQYICQQALSVGAVVLYISTDYVFDGTTPPHQHDTPTNPLNAYGHSKLEGEQVVLGVHPGNLVLRVPILYGEVEYLGESAITIMFPKVKDNSKEFVTSDYEKRYPTLCSDVAFVLRELVTKKLQDSSLQGVYQWSGSEEMTKYEMCLQMAEIFKLPTDHIVPDRTPSSGAVRPYNAHLSSTKIEALGIAKRVPFKQGVKPVLEPFLKDKES